MERNRLIAIVCAIIAAVLVIIAGKSCADDAIKNGRKKSVKSEYVSRPDVSYSYQSASEPTGTSETDAFGRPVQTQTEPVSRDIFGRPVTTEPDGTSVVITYDDNGNVVSTSVVDASAYESSVTAVSEADAPTEGDTGPTTTTIPPYLNGFDHNKYDEEGNTVPTLPKDFTIIIN